MRKHSKNLDVLDANLPQAVGNDAGLCQGRFDEQNGQILQGEF